MATTSPSQPINARLWLDKTWLQHLVDRRLLPILDDLLGAGVVHPHLFWRVRIGKQTSWYHNAVFQHVELRDFIKILNSKQTDLDKVLREISQCFNEIRQEEPDCTLGRGAKRFAVMVKAIERSAAGNIDQFRRDKMQVLVYELTVDLFAMGLVRHRENVPGNVKLVLREKDD